MLTTFLIILFIYTVAFHYFSREIFAPKEYRKEDIDYLRLRIRQLEDGLRRLENDLKDK